MPTVEVTCPEGVSEGEVLHVEYEGASFAVHVPPGVQCGYTFAVELETAATQPEPEPEYECPPQDDVSYYLPDEEQCDRWARDDTV